MQAAQERQGKLQAQLANLQRMRSDLKVRIPKENDQRSNLKTIGRSGRARKERGAWRRHRGSAIFVLERRL